MLLAAGIALVILGTLLSAWVVGQQRSPEVEWPNDPRFRSGMGLILLGGVLVTWTALNP